MAMANNHTRLRIRITPTSANDPQLDQIWERLETSLREILHRNNAGLSFEELYRQAYTMVLHKRADRLYNGVSVVLQRHLDNTVKQEVLRFINNDFLRNLNRIWEDYRFSMIMIRDILMYLDRVYVEPSQGVKKPIYTMGVELFYNRIIKSDDNIRLKMQNTLLEIIANERAHLQVNHADLKNTCTLLRDLEPQVSSSSGHHHSVNRRIYEEEFEKPYLRETEKFYSNEADQLLTQQNASVYIEEVNSRIEEERRRANEYMHPPTEERVVAKLRAVLIQRHMVEVVHMRQGGIVDLLDKVQTDHRTDRLQTMYRLVKEVEGGLKLLVDEVYNYLLEQGRKIVQDVTALGPNVPQGATRAHPGIELVQQLINLRDRYDAILVEAFDDDNRLKKQISDAFESFMNEKENSRIPDHLSAYMDEKLRSNKLSDTEVEQILSKCFTLLARLSDQLKFEDCYRKLLAKRLLSDKSASIDVESQVITRLRAERGYDSTSKLEGMLKDMRISEDVNKAFHERTGSSRAVDLQVKVLTSSMWPASYNAKPTDAGDVNVTGVANGTGPNTTAPATSGGGRGGGATSSRQSANSTTNSAKPAGGAAILCPLPQNCLQAFQAFSRFYLEKHDGRRLVLNPQFGTAELRVTLGGAGDKSYIAQCSSTRQMALLCLFNERSQWTFADLITRMTVDCPEQDLRGLLHILYAKTYKLLIRSAASEAKAAETAGKEIQPLDVFTINTAFSSQRIRFKLSAQLPRKMAENAAGSSGVFENQTADDQQLEESRRNQIEAAIVRLMKVNKKMQLNTLIAKVAEILRQRFQPSTQIIKSSIEQLIEKEFLKRDATDPSMFDYCA